MCQCVDESRYNSSLSKAGNGVEVALMKAQIAAIFEGLFDEITSSRGGPFVSRQVRKISSRLDVFVNVRNEPMVWHRSDLYLKWKLVLYSNFTEKLRTIGRNSSSSRKPGVSSLIMGSALKAERLRSNNRTFIIFVMTNTTTDTFRLRLFYTQRGKR